MFPLYTAQLLWRDGLSLIPLFGREHSTPKLPPLSWSQYQKAPAPWPQVVQWITGTPSYELAVVTGRVSGVVVVDFDDTSLWEQFTQSAVFLLIGGDKHLTVRTRRGIHFYMPVGSAGAAIAGRKGAGWDLQADGQYVVAPHSTVKGHGYAIVAGSIERMGKPNEASLAAVIAWLVSETTPPTPEPNPEPSGPSMSKEPGAHVVEPLTRLAMPTIQALYKTWCHDKGRNWALYLAARLAHDHFYNEEACTLGLLALHVATPARDGSEDETPAQREREGLKTIASAYRKARRPVRHTEVKQLPNVLRERLNQRGLTFVARLLDALRAKGFAAGVELGRPAVEQAVAGVVGSHSQRRAWEWLRDAGFVPPSTPSHADALRDGYRQGEQYKCLCIQCQNRRKLFRYKEKLILPSDMELSSCLEVPLNKASDVLTVEQIANIRHYRAGLHGNFLMRRAGKYTVQWLARRVGVSKRTLHRYNRHAQIAVEPQITREYLTPALFNRLPDIGEAYEHLYRVNQRGGVVTPGYYLEDETGKRYPAVRVVAAKAKKSLWLCVRGLNRYHHASQPEQATLAPRMEQAPSSTSMRREPTAQAPRAALPMPSAPTPAPAPIPAPPAPRPSAPTIKIKRPPLPPAARKLPPHNARRYRSPLAVEWQEALATRLHRELPDISMNTARRAVELCGGQKIHSALATLDKRNDVRDRAALLLTMIDYPSNVRHQHEQAQRRAYKRATRRAQRGGD